MTTHSLARELLSKPDGFLTATLKSEDEEREYIIQSYQRTKTHANIDDSVTYWTLNLCDNNK